MFMPSIMMVRMVSHDGRSRLAVWEDPNSSTWWNTSVVELKSGAVFAILDDDDQMGNDSDLYAILIGMRLWQELPEDDSIIVLGRTAIAVITQ